MLAAESGMTAVCDYLLSRGADVIAVDDQGLTIRCGIMFFVNILISDRFG